MHVGCALGMRQHTCPCTCLHTSPCVHICPHTGVGASITVRICTSDGSIGLVRVWAGNKLEWFTDFDVVYAGQTRHFEGPVTSSAYYFEANFGPDRYSWTTGAWSPATCPTDCGRGTSTRTRTVVCQGDASGTVNATACAGTAPATVGSCPGTGCCGGGASVIHVATDGAHANACTHACTRKARTLDAHR